MTYFALRNVSLLCNGRVTGRVRGQEVAVPYTGRPTLDGGHARPQLSTRLSDAIVLEIYVMAT